MVFNFSNIFKVTHPNLNGAYINLNGSNNKLISNNLFKAKKELKQVQNEYFKNKTKLDLFYKEKSYLEYQSELIIILSEIKNWFDSYKVCLDKNSEKIFEENLTLLTNLILESNTKNLILLFKSFSNLIKEISNLLKN